MSLDTYANLKSEMISFTGRDDLSSSFDTFLALGETAIYANEDKPLRLSNFNTSTTLVTVGGTNAVALPADFLELRSLKLQDGGTECELTYNSPNAMPIGVSGQPMFYTITGSDITFDSVPDGVYSLTLNYYAKPTGLSATNQTNTVLTNYPNIYFYAVMFSVYDYTTELDLAEGYRSKMIRAIKGAMKSDSKGMRPNAVMRNRGLTP